MKSLGVTAQPCVRVTRRLRSSRGGTLRESSVGGAPQPTRCPCLHTRGTCHRLGLSAITRGDAWAARERKTKKKRVAAPVIAEGVEAGIVRTAARAGVGRAQEASPPLVRRSRRSRRQIEDRKKPGPWRPGTVPRLVQARATRDELDHVRVARPRASRGESAGMPGDQSPSLESKFRSPAEWATHDVCHSAGAAGQSHFDGHPREVGIRCRAACRMV